MPTVVDELVVEIGLDGSKFREGRQSLQDEMGKTRKSVESFGADVEQAGQKIGEVFSFAKRGVMGLVGALVGGEAASFIEHVASMDSHTMQLAHSIGMSTHELSKWQYLVESVGGSASDANASFSSLSDTFQGIRFGGQVPTGGFAALLSRSGVDAFNTTPDQALQKFMGFLQGQSEVDQRRWLNQIPGMNEGTMFALMQILRDPDSMRNLNENLEKFKLASDESGKSALDLQQKTTLLHAAFDDLARTTLPAVTWLVEKLAKALGRDEGEANALINGNAKEKMQALFGDTVGGYLFNLFSPPSASASPSPSGGSRGDRNNNPGNIKYGPWAQSHGATGQDSGGFATFPNWAAGADAAGALLHSAYQGLTLAQIQQRWVGNPDQNYLSSMMSSTGLKAGDVPNLNDPNVIAALLKGMMRGEGTHVPRSATQKTSSITIGSIHVASSKADPKAVADQIPDAMKRYSMLSGINTGLA